MDADEEDAKTAVVMKRENLTWLGAPNVVLFPGQAALGVHPPRAPGDMFSRSGVRHISGEGGGDGGGAGAGGGGGRLRLIGGAPPEASPVRVSKKGGASANGGRPGSRVSWRDLEEVSRLYFRSRTPTSNP